MKFLTCNIRCDHNQDGANSFCHRKGHLIGKILREEPHIACFQEVLPHVADFLADSLPEYTVVGCGRDAQLLEEQVSIAFRRDTFTLISMETFWFSPYPHVPGSRYATMSNWPRVCNEVVLRERATGELYKVFSIHMDNLYDHARLQAVRQLMHKLAQEDVFPSAHVIIAGDFNAEPDDASVQAMDASFRDAAADSGPTFHDYGRMDKPVKIDYIFVQDDLMATGLQLWNDVHDGVYLSDHYPVCVELSLR